MKMTEKNVAFMDEETRELLAIKKYSCGCPDGLKYDMYNKVCKCAGGFAFNEQTKKCECPKGFKLNKDKTGCDVDLSY